MRPLFHPRLVNSPLGDPALFISFLHKSRAILFDVGDISKLSTRDILKLTHVFVSHTHMDHFIGFDSLLRLCLGRHKTLHLFGPKGFISNVEAKLGAYNWNLVKSYANCFSIHATELREDRLISRRYLCHQQFENRLSDEIQVFKGTLHQESSMKIDAIILDHQIPCLGFSLKESFHINIRKNELKRLGLKPGPWLQRFKHLLYANTKNETSFEFSSAESITGPKRIRMGELAKQIAIITPGQKISYITDVTYSNANVAKIETFVADSDHLFIEASFLHEARQMARKKNHLTAWQAGRLAARAGVKKFTLFHFSPRYSGRETELQTEAERAFETHR